jgi:hypothetical protein
MQRKHLLLAALSLFLAVGALLPLTSQASTTGILLPTSDGNYTQWTPSSGTTHYTLVNETPCDGTTTYNSTDTTGNRDSYGVSLASVSSGAVISQIDIVPCASRDKNGTGSATMDVFYRFNGVDSSATGSYALSGTTPTIVATTSFGGLNLFKTSTSTLEIGAVLSAGTKGARSSRIATVLTYTLTTPSAPTGLVATNISSSQNNLSWTDNSSNELGFKVYRALNNGSFSQVATTTQNAVTYSDTGLTPDQYYSYYVAAYNSAGQSNSSTSSAITYNSVPSAPSGLTAYTASADTLLTWTDNSINEDGFSVERSSDNITFSQIATTTRSFGGTVTYTDTGSGASVYYYRVQAYNAIGNSAYSSTASNRNIGLDSVSSTSTGHFTTSMTLSHTVTSSSDRVLFVGVRTCCDTGLTPMVTYAGVAMTLVNSVDSLNPDNGGTAYLYYLVNPSPGTHDVFVNLPNAPQANFNVTAVSYTGVDQTSPIDVEATQAEQLNTGDTYTQSVTTTVADDWTLMMAVCDGGGTTSPATGSTERDSGNARILLDSGGPISPAGSASLGFTDAISNPHFASVMVGFKRSLGPVAPTNLVAINISSSQNNLTWNDNSWNELGFKVYRALNNGSYSQVATTTENTTSYSDTGLTADQTYSYYVAAYTPTNQTNANTARAVTYNTPPASPSALSITASRTDDVLTWSDNSANEDGFSIERSTDDVSFSQITTTTLNLGGSATYTDAGSSGTLYYYRVLAYNTQGNSGYSNTASNTSSNVIAFDNVTTTSTGSGTTLTLTHTVGSAADRILFVGVRTCCSTGLTPTVTYDGATTTLVDSVDSLNPNNGGTAYLYYPVDPSSGTHDVVVSLSSSQSNINAIAISYTGVDQTSPIDREGTQAAQMNTNQAYTQSVTTTPPGDWVLLTGVCDGSNVSPTPASGSIQRGTFANVGSLVDSGGPINPAGSASLGFYDNELTNPHYASVMVGFKSR